MRAFNVTLTLAGLMFVAVVSAQAQVNIRTKADGKQKITTLDPVKPPEVSGKEFENAKAQGTVLNANDWKCGYQFTDEKNRQWKKAFGPALDEKPNTVPGWLIQTEEGKMYFMTQGGTLYTLSKIVKPKND